VKRVKGGELLAGRATWRHFLPLTCYIAPN
jgi:hypothetical protein